MLAFKNFNLGSIKEAVKLTPGELKKPNSITGEDRLDILVRLIRDNKPLELAKGGTFVVTDIDDAISQIEIFKKLGKPFNLHGDGKTISSSDLGKSSVFGGGGGSGGGTLNTKITESHQCVLCQAMLDHGIQSEEFFQNPDILKAAYKQVDVDATLDEVLSVEDGWFHSSYESSVLLIKQGYINKSHKLHRNSKEMNTIYALKNVAYKNSDQKPVKDDKWNPGDFWAVEKSFDLKSLDTSSITAYNKSLLQAFVDRQLVGISLKLVKKKAKAKEYNIKLPPDTDDHKLLKILLQGEKRGTFWSNKGATIIFDEGKFELRAGSAGGAIKGEIALKTARGGGAGYGIMSDAMKLVFRKKIPDNGKINQLAKKIVKGDKRSVTIFFELYSNFYNNDTFENFAKELSQKDVYWVGSKLACLYVVYNVDKNTGTKANRWLTKIINYAGSKSEDSSAYVKVYE
jgi:hypothetical protein